MFQGFCSVIILHALIKEPTEVQEQYFSRLERVVDSASDIGWGYYDYISDLLKSIFQIKAPSNSFNTANSAAAFQTPCPAQRSEVLPSW